MRLGFGCVFVFPPLLVSPLPPPPPPSHQMPRRQKHLPKPHDVRVRRAQPVVEDFSQRRPRHAGPPLQKLDGHLGVGGAVQGAVDEAKGALGREGRGGGGGITYSKKNGGVAPPPKGPAEKREQGRNQGGAADEKGRPSPSPPAPRPPVCPPQARAGVALHRRGWEAEGAGRSRRGAGRAPDFFGGGARSTKKGSRRPPPLRRLPSPSPRPPPLPAPRPPPVLTSFSDRSLT